MKVKGRDELPRLSGREMTVLELLLRSPGEEMYGLELVRESKGDLPKGTVYVTLSRMQDKGYLSSRTVPPEDGRIGIPRRLYKVTGFGRSAYEAWEFAKRKFGGLVEEAAL